MLIILLNYAEYVESYQRKRVHHALGDVFAELLHQKQLKL